MIHSLSFSAAEIPPAMYRSATLAMLVSRTSMNVAIETDAAMIHGLTFGRMAGESTPRGAGWLIVERFLGRADPETKSVPEPGVRRGIPGSRDDGGQYR